MDLWQHWWVWMSGAVVLATLEVLAPGYIFLGFAVGALVVGALLLVNVPLVGLPLASLVFALASLVAYLAMRKFFALKGGSVKIWDRDINEN